MCFFLQEEDQSNSLPVYQCSTLFHWCIQYWYTGIPSLSLALCIVLPCINSIGVYVTTSRCIRRRWRIPIAGMVYMLLKLDYWGSLGYTDRRKTIYTKTHLLQGTHIDIELSTVWRICIAFSYKLYCTLLLLPVDGNTGLI